MYRVLTVKSYIFSTLFIAFICCLYASQLLLASLRCREKLKMKRLANSEKEKNAGKKLQQNGWKAKKKKKNWGIFILEFGMLRNFNCHLSRQYVYLRWHHRGASPFNCTKIHFHFLRQSSVRHFTCSRCRQYLHLSAVIKSIFG